MISLARLMTIIRAWKRRDWEEYYTLIGAMTAYELQQTYQMLHDIARAMEGVQEPT